MTADDESRVVAYMTETGLIPQPFWDALDAADLMAAYMADDDPCDDPNCGTCKEAFNTLDVYRTARAKLPARCLTGPMPGRYTANEWFHFWEQTKAENDTLRARLAGLQAEVSGLVLELRQVQEIADGLRREVISCRRLLEAETAHDDN